jgi:phage-related protein
MDVLNYDSAVSAYNNLQAFQSEKQEQLKQLVEQYKAGAEQVVLPAIDLFRRGREAYNRLTNQAENIVDEGKTAVEGAVQGAEGAVKGIASDTLGSLGSTAENVLSNVTSRIGQFSSGIRGIGNDLSNRMMTNAFERDPEGEIASGSENMGVFDRVQSIFRGGVSEGENAVSSAISGVKGAVSSAVSEGTEAATSAASGIAEGVGTAVGEGIGAVVGEAIPVIGELGMLGLGIYDFVKAETTKAPVIQAMASPVLEKGI